MSIRIPVVWSGRHRLHQPGGEVYVGVRTPGTEVPARADAIRAALESEGATIHDLGDPDPTPLNEALRRVHDHALLDWLAAAWDEWRRAALPDDPGQDRVVPYLFPTPGLTRHLGAASGALAPPGHGLPASAAARAGLFAYDTMTLIGPGTGDAARAAAATALRAADMVAGGEPAAFALTRPPGHHAARAAFGGSCYLNNAAVAADRLRSALDGPVAILDVDAHHGNGTQDVFYEDPAVLTASVHVDPGAGWFPHFLGFAAERGAGEGEGANLNVPLPPGTADAEWLAAVTRVAEWAGEKGAIAVVLALGVDAASSDPESPLEVSAGGYRRAALAIGELGLPTVVVQEGGYDLEAVGGLVAAALHGLEEGGGRGEGR